LLLNQFILSSTSAGADDAPRRNAALNYWQAFAFMPSLSREVDNTSTIQGIVRPVDQKLVQVIRQSESALQLFHRGAKLSHCDWQLDLRKNGFETWLPHLDKAHPFIRFPLLRARYRFEQGRDIEAIDDIIATMALSRHVTRDGTVQGFERGYIMEETTIFVVAAYLPEMSSEALDTLAARLSSLPQRTPLRESILNERKSLEWIIAKVEESDQKRLQELCRSLTGSDAKADALLKTSGGAKGLVKLAVEMRPLYEEAALLPLLPFLETKGHLQHTKDGREFIYRPVKSRVSTGRSALKRVLRTFFDGSLEKAVAAIVSDPRSRVSASELKRLGKVVRTAVCASRE